MVSSGFTPDSLVTGPKDRQRQAGGDIPIPAGLVKGDPLSLSTEQPQRIAEGVTLSQQRWRLFREAAIRATARAPTNLKSPL